MVLREGDLLSISDPNLAQSLDEQELREYCSGCQIVSVSIADNYVVMWKPVGVRCRDIPHPHRNFLCLERALALLLAELPHCLRSITPCFVTSLGTSECG